VSPSRSSYAEWLGDDEGHPMQRLLDGVDLIRNLIGATLLLAAAIAYIVMGHTAGRLVGGGLLALLLLPWIVPAVWRRVTSRDTD
jgi:hypothetical protein